MLHHVAITLDHVCPGDPADSGPDRLGGREGPEQAEVRLGTVYITQCAGGAPGAPRLGAQVAGTDLASKEKVRLITEHGDDISAAAISYKDAMRTQLTGIKKKIDDGDESANTAVMGAETGGRVWHWN